MPLGDSITAGTNSTDLPTLGGYRNELYTQLSAAGFAVTFEGSSTYNASPLLAAANETAHEGHPGFLIAGTPLASFPGGFYPGLYEYVDTWFSRAQPDIVLLMIGTNDMIMNIDPANAPARLSQLLDKITADDPHARIVLSTLLNPSLSVRTTNYNLALPEVVASRANVTLFDNANLLDPQTDYTSDMVHPNVQGYDKLGDALAQDVETVLAPEPASVALAAVGLLLSWCIRFRPRSNSHSLRN